MVPLLQAILGHFVHAIDVWLKKAASDSVVLCL